MNEPSPLWRAAFVVIGVLLSGLGYMVERRLASIEDQLHTLDHRMDVTGAQSERNAESLKYFWDWYRPK